MFTKDYIYLDEEFLNSHLAQFEKGLLIKETDERGMESSDSTNESMDAETGINGILGIGLKLQSKVSEGDSSTESEFTKNIVENVLHDYAVDLLIQHCTDNNILFDFNTASEGSFVTYSSPFQIYDFNYLKDLTDPNIIGPILPDTPQKPSSQSGKRDQIEYQKQKQALQKCTETFNLIHNLSVFADKLLSDSLLIKVQKGIIICKRSKLRLNKAQVSFENESNRKIQVFGVVSTKKEETHPQGIFPFFKPSDIDKVSSMLFDITLSSFNILNNNDKIIKPIAIYFEAD